MTVREWMKREGIEKVMDAATRLGIAPSAVSSILKSVPIKTIRVAERVSMHSGGLVSVEDLVYPKGVPSKVSFTTDNADARLVG
jgi:hypothetical protein